MHRTQRIHGPGYLEPCMIQEIDPVFCKPVHEIHTCDMWPLKKGFTQLTIQF